MFQPFSSFTTIILFLLSASWSSFIPTAHLASTQDTGKPGPRYLHLTPLSMPGALHKARPALHRKLAWSRRNKFLLQPCPPVRLDLLSTHLLQCLITASVPPKAWAPAGRFGLVSADEPHEGELVHYVKSKMNNEIAKRSRRAQFVPAAFQKTTAILLLESCCTVQEYKKDGGNENREIVVLLLWAFKCGGFITNWNKIQICLEYCILSICTVLYSPSVLRTAQTPIARSLTKYPCNSKTHALGQAHHLWVRQSLWGKREHFCLPSVFTAW